MKQTGKKGTVFGRRAWIHETSQQVHILEEVFGGEPEPSSRSLTAAQRLVKAKRQPRQEVGFPQSWALNVV
jgi:hypothetical protein